MALTGEDFRGGPSRQLFEARNPAGLGLSIAIAVGLLLINQVLQLVFGIVAQIVMFGSAFTSQDNAIRGTLLGMLPAALLTAVIAWQFTKVRGGRPRDVLNLRWPRFGALGWLLVVLGYFATVIAIFVTVMIVLSLAGFEQSTTGLVEETMSGMAADPSIYLLVLPSVILGAPLAEELIFRGQLFTALSQTRIGFAGAAIVTSALWSLLHFTGNWFIVGLIFIMGLVLGWQMRRYGSLWVTMVCHALWNASTSLVLFAGLGGQ